MSETGGHDAPRPPSLKDPHIYYILGNTIGAHCHADGVDVETVERSGVLPQIEAEADSRFTLVHSTSEAIAEKILQDGFDLQPPHRMWGSAINGSFVQVVPSHYPDAHAINSFALGYRYHTAPAKVILQFPFPFPKEALGPNPKSVVWGYTPLHRLQSAKAAGVIEERDRHFFIPASCVAGVLNLDTGRVTTRERPQQAVSPEDSATTPRRRILGQMASHFLRRS